MKNRKNLFIGLSILTLVIVLGGLFTIQRIYLTDIPIRLAGLFTDQPAAVALAVSSPFYYTFNVNGTLDEAGAMDQSWSPYWWLNSGGQMHLSLGIGQTVQGNLGTLSKWRLAYFLSNPTDTDNGYHPQNIFRLVTRSLWQNFKEEAYFRINADNVSDSPNRNQSNGILLFNRYLDSNNLYYAGIRVDGLAVIKKKMNGTYYTLNSKKIYTDASYERKTSPNLLPHGTWVGLRSEVLNNPDNTVTIRLFTDVGKTGVWKLVLETKDDNKSFGGNAISSSGYAGIRLDFMDVDFSNYKITNITS